MFCKKLRGITGAASCFVLRYIILYTHFKKPVQPQQVERVFLLIPDQAHIEHNIAICQKNQAKAKLLESAIY